MSQVIIVNADGVVIKNAPHRRCSTMTRKRQWEPSPRQLGLLEDAIFENATLRKKFLMAVALLDRESGFKVVSPNYLSRTILRRWYKKGWRGCFDGSVYNVHEHHSTSSRVPSDAYTAPGYYHP